MLTKISGTPTKVFASMILIENDEYLKRLKFNLVPDVCISLKRLSFGLYLTRPLLMRLLGS